MAYSRKIEPTLLAINSSRSLSSKFALNDLPASASLTSVYPPVCVSDLVRGWLAFSRIAIEIYLSYFDISVVMISFPCFSISFFILVQCLYNSLIILIIFYLSSKYAVNLSMFIIMSTNGTFVMKLVPTGPYSSIFI